MRQKIYYVWGSVLSVHGLKVGMLPNFYLLFSSRLYKILNLNLFICQYIFIIQNKPFDWHAMWMFKGHVNKT